jgi:hypothetical protein
MVLLHAAAAVEEVVLLPSLVRSNAIFAFLCPRKKEREEPSFSPDRNSDNISGGKIAETAALCESERVVENMVAIYDG